MNFFRRKKWFIPQPVIMQMAGQTKSPYINSSNKYADKLLPRVFRNDTDEIKVYVSVTREPVTKLRLGNDLIHGAELRSLSDASIIRVQCRIRTRPTFDPSAIASKKKAGIRVPGTRTHCWH